MRRALSLFWGVVAVAALSDGAAAQYRSYPPPGYYRPPCESVTPSPLRGAARGAAGGAIIGAIAGNAGAGAAIGAGFGGIANAARRGSVRSSGGCY